MPHVLSSGCRIYWREAGQGQKIVFIHEFAGDHRSWEHQISHFSRGWRCVTLSARGYPGSDVPRDEEAYGQSQFNADVVAVMDVAGIDRAHIVGLSMGGYTALMLGLEHPSRCLSVVSAGAGSGSSPATREAFVADCRANAKHFEAQGKIDADVMGRSATRIQLLNKDPEGWARFVAHLAEHSAQGSANTLRRVQSLRPSLYHFERRFAAMAVPTLLIVGDEDEPCLDVNLWMKRSIPSAQLVVLPGTGHAVSLEEAPLFNMLVERFIVSVERGSWLPRDPRAVVGGITSLFPRS